jgi:molybdenum cofactor guanylyltransferase
METPDLRLPSVVCRPSSAKASSPAAFFYNTIHGSVNMTLETISLFPNNITGVILAGGRATRMNGQDKGLLLLNGKYMIEYVIAALRPQVGPLLISANRHQSRYVQLGHCPVLADTFGHYDGPLAGIATCLQEAKTDYVLFVPCDSPFLSSQLAKRLYAGLLEHHADVSVVEQSGQIQPVWSLWKRNLLPKLLAFLKTDERKLGRFLWQQALARIDFSDVPETCLNVNTPEELEEVANRLIHSS